MLREGGGEGAIIDDINGGGGEAAARRGNSMLGYTWEDLRDRSGRTLKTRRHNLGTPDTCLPTASLPTPFMSVYSLSCLCACPPHLPIHCPSSCLSPSCLTPFLHAHATSLFTVPLSPCLFPFPFDSLPARFPLFIPTVLVYSLPHGLPSCLSPFLPDSFSACPR